MLAQPLAGGAAREVVKCIAPGGGYFSAPKGIHYIACGSGTDAVVRVLHPKTGHDEVFGTLEKASGPYFGLAVSGDGTTILYSKVVNQGSDLMLIESFR